MELKFDVELYPMQQEVIDACLSKTTKDIVVVSTGRQVGKSMLGIMLTIYWALMSPNTIVMVMQPDFSVYLNKLYFDYQVALKTMEDNKMCKFDGSKHNIKFGNGSLIQLISAESNSAGRSLSAHYVWIDEAAFFKDTDNHPADDIFYKNIFPTFAVTGMKMLITSTPNGRRGFFYNLFNSDLTEHITWATKENIHLRPDFLVIAAEITPPQIYEQEYNAVFGNTDGDVFSHLDECSTITEWKPYDKTKKYFAGLDWGQKVDNSVLTIVDNSGEVVFIRSMTGTSYEIMAATFANDLKEYNAYARAENNSIGEEANNHLLKHYQHFERFETTSKTKPLLITQLIIAFNTFDIKIPTDTFYQALKFELSNFTFHKTQNGYIQYSAPAGKHDDHVMSLSFAYSIMKLRCNNFDVKTYTREYTLDQGFF